MAATDHELATSDYYAYRVQKLGERQKTGLLTYPHKFPTDISVKEFVERFGSLEAGSRDESVVCSLAGRIMTIRISGAKLVFYELRGNGHHLQVWCDAKSYQGDFEEITGTLARGDIVGVTGFPARTKRGELSVVPTRLVLLSPCLKTLPGSHNKLTDPETRFRRRHLDFIANHERIRPIFETRAAVINHIRHFFNERGYLEVETPSMVTVAGGAAARPFVTHHHDMDTDLFLRISPELFLKELVVGGFERVYELGRQFRNEGCDATHNSDFTSIESYCAYADYQDMMKMTEDLFSSLVLALKGSHKIQAKKFGGLGDEPLVEVDFTPPYRRVSMVEELERIAGCSFPRPLDGEECNAFLVELCRVRGIDCPPPTTTARLLDKLTGEWIEPTCVNPTFICDHPQLMSPLAKWHRGNPEFTERFELFIMGKEFCNSYTELNDPHKQRECFAAQLKDKEAGDVEAQMIDEVFCDALDHGLPPTGGHGIGIDRLVSLLAGEHSIREVLLFPMMRPLPPAEQKKILE